MPHGAFCREARINFPRPPGITPLAVPSRSEPLPFPETTLTGMSRSETAPLRLQNLEGEAFQVLGLGDGRKDWVIRGLRERRHAAQASVRVEGRCGNRVLKQTGADVMRTAEGGEDASGLEQLEGAQMNLLVAAHRVRHGG